MIPALFLSVSLRGSVRAERGSEFEAPVFSASKPDCGIPRDVSFMRLSSDLAALRAANIDGGARRARDRRHP